MSNFEQKWLTGIMAKPKLRTYLHKVICKCKFDKESTIFGGSAANWHPSPGLRNWKVHSNS